MGKSELNEQEFIIPKNLLRSLKSRTLFYPSSGEDFYTPVEAFSPWISDFWFVDTAYDQMPLIADNSGFVLKEYSIESFSGETIVHRQQFTVTVSRQIYKSPDIKRLLKIHKCQGRGYDAFRKLIKDREKQLSIFFHRGDSQGDGGSDFFWLDQARLRNILEVLEDGGFIVTDGSNAMPEFSRFLMQNITGTEALSKLEEFIFENRHFKPVGCLDNRYGPTIIWQVKLLSVLSSEVPDGVKIVLRINKRAKYSRMRGR